MYSEGAELRPADGTIDTIMDDVAIRHHLHFDASVDTADQSVTSGNTLLRHYPVFGVGSLCPLEVFGPVLLE
jgi:hypothetical protein